ncbi:hypothetical protein IFM89_001412 [Coptis chinensis]|uniref:RNase H type-1 domain-containing protein n=1 Tax=Coptis chinensis TaxID=261450 RepID=A0A835I4Q1_9MAGN|nr:hypothetical protein IFM89_001412 [Coptis chinensis]
MPPIRWVDMIEEAAERQQEFTPHATSPTRTHSLGGTVRHIRGIANDKSQQRLEKLVKQGNPEFIGIAEPKISPSDLPVSFISSLGSYELLQVVAIQLHYLQGFISSSHTNEIVSSMNNLVLSGEAVFFLALFSKIPSKKTRVGALIAVRAHGKSKGHMNNTLQDLNTLHSLRLAHKLRHAPQIIECFWILLPMGILKVNTYGCSLGNSGRSGWGNIHRNSNREVIGAAAGGMGITTNFMA